MADAGAPFLTYLHFIGGEVLVVQGVHDHVDQILGGAMNPAILRRDANGVPTMVRLTDEHGNDVGVNPGAVAWTTG